MCKKLRKSTVDAVHSCLGIILLLSLFLIFYYVLTSVYHTYKSPNVNNQFIQNQKYVDSFCTQHSLQTVGRIPNDCEKVQADANLSYFIFVLRLVIQHWFSVDYWCGSLFCKTLSLQLAHNVGSVFFVFFAVIVILMIYNWRNHVIRPTRQYKTHREDERTLEYIRREEATKEANASRDAHLQAQNRINYIPFDIDENSAPEGMTDIQLLTETDQTSFPPVPRLQHSSLRQRYVVPI